jgi:aminoglycoside 3-N-acetyltransferase
MSLFEAASGLAVRCLSRERLVALRTQYLSVRAKLHPVMRVVYGTFDTAALRDHLERRIGADFEILMVHSSVNNMQPMYTGSPLEFVQMLMSFCGPHRTLAMPAFYFGDPAIGGADKTFRERPRFDLRRTPSQMGLATELFRRSREVVQSRHPVYRVAAIGPLAKQLTEGHELAESASGPGTPFDFMAARNTRILGVGKRYEVLTQVHHAEDMMGEEFPVPRGSASEFHMTLVDGQEEILFRSTHRGLLWRRNMWKLAEIMNRETLQEWEFHHVPLFSTRAGDVTAALVAAARRGVTLYEKP